jgi:hypothetical protein
MVTVVTGAFIHLSVDGRMTARKDLRSKLVAVTETGVRVGEDHGKAKLTDAQVEEMRDR